LKEAASAGARYASYIMLRLPHGLKELFLHWLETYFPERKQKVINRLTDLFDGKLYDSAYHLRGRGKGVYADQIADMFKLASKKYELNKHRLQLSTEHFKNPEKKQLNLFD
jgi:DNA repair photolyase